MEDPFVKNTFETLADKRIDLTAPSFGEMNKATVDLFVHGLAHAPWAENFQMLCSQGTSFLESLDDTEEPNGIKFKVTKLIYGMKANDPSVGLNTAANLRQLNHIIDQYPVTTTGMWISTVNCTPVRKEMETLRDEEEISDEIINAIFSL